MTDPHPPAAPEPNTQDGKPKRALWENIALWLFLAGILVASVAAGYLLWVKISAGSH